MQYKTEIKPTTSFDRMTDDAFVPVLILPGEHPDASEILYDDGQSIHVWAILRKHPQEHPGYTWYLYDLSYSYPSPVRVQEVQSGTPALEAYYTAVMAEVEGGGGDA